MEDKYVLLFVLGLLLCGCWLQGRDIRDTLMAKETSRIADLQWDNNHLIIVSTGSREEKKWPDVLPPADLRPLFFLPIPLNEADYELLLTIPGIGPATAESILRARHAGVRFSRLDDLEHIKGIGPKKKMQIAAHVVLAE